jgi:molecular chaperone DnaJ/curved DNA-binding protein
MAEDYYKTLGVPRNASQAEIQKAYREKARQYHPDLHPDDKGAKRKFQEVQAAFDILNDPEKREMYDRYGSSFEAYRAGAGPRPGGKTRAGAPPDGGFEFNFDEGGFNQFFGDRFEGGPVDLSEILRQFRRGGSGTGKGRAPGAGAAASRRGADLTQDIEIPFNIAIGGGEVQLSVQRQSSERLETIAVKIPPGVEDGKKIRLRGQGEPAKKGGVPGDIILSVHVASHPFFHRQGANLVVRVPVTLGEAANGAKVDVPTPTGTVSIHVPPGTSSGTKLRIRGKGVAARNATPGDLLAEIQIVLPKGLSESDRSLLGEIDRRYPQDPRSALRW